MSTLQKKTAQWLCAFSVGALLSCQALAADIVVGQIGPFTGLPSPDAHEVKEGAQAYFDQVNKAGGVNGRKLAFFTLDDEFKSDVFKLQLSKAAERKPVALISPIGSSALSALTKEKLLADANFIVINAIPGAVAFRTPGDPKLFHIRASDGDQFARILNHGRTVGVTQLHVLHQDLPIGKGGYEFVKTASPDFGYKPVAGTESKHEDTALSQAAKTTVSASPQSVLLIGTPKFMADAAKHLRASGFNRSISALSYLPAPLLIKIAGAEGARGVGIAQTFPNPQGRNLPVQQDFQKTMGTFAPKISTYTSFHFEGYISARVLVDGLKRAKGNTSPEALSTALRNTGEFDYGGYRVDFSKSNSGSSWTDISVVDAEGKLRY